MKRYASCAVVILVLIGLLCGLACPLERKKTPPRSRSDSRRREMPLLDQTEQAGLDALADKLLNDPANITDEDFDLPKQPVASSTVQRLLRRSLHNPDWRVRPFVLRHVAYTPEMFDLLFDVDPQFRKELLLKICNFNDAWRADKSILDDVIDVGLNDESPEVRKVAMEAALRYASLPAAGRIIRLLPKFEDEHLERAASVLSRITRRKPTLGKAHSREELMKDWQAWLEKNQAALEAFGQARRRSGGVLTLGEKGLGALLTTPKILHGPDSPAKLTLTLHNFSNVPATLPAGTRIVLRHEMLFRESFFNHRLPTVVVARQIIIAPYADRAFTIEVPPMGYHPKRMELAAYCSLPGDDKKIRLICQSNSVPLSWDQSVSDMVAGIMPSMGDRRNACLVSAHFPVGTPKNQVDEAMSVTRRQPVVTATQDGVEVAYAFDWQWYWRARFARSADGELLLRAPMSFHVRRRSPKPDDVSIADWVLATSGVYCRLEATSPSFPAGSPATVDITFRNVDTVPHTIPAPASPFGQNKFLAFTICSDNRRWTESVRPPATILKAKEIAKRALHVGRPGFSTSFITYDGKMIAFVNEDGKLLQEPLAHDRLVPTGDDVRAIILAPGESYKLRTTIGGKQANRPTGHSTDPDIWRMRLMVWNREPWKDFIAHAYMMEPLRWSNTISVEFKKPE